MKIKYIKTPLHRYTFNAPKIKLWVQEYCDNKFVLNLFAGWNKLENCIEIRNDADECNRKSWDKIDLYEEQIKSLQTKIQYLKDNMKPNAGLRGRLELVSKLRGVECIGSYNSHIVVLIKDVWYTPYYEEGSDFNGIPKLREVD